MASKSLSAPSNSTCHASNFKLSLTTGRAYVFLISVDTNRVLSKKTVTVWPKTGNLFPEEVKPKRDLGSGISPTENRSTVLRRGWIKRYEMLRLSTSLPLFSSNISRQPSTTQTGYWKMRPWENWKVQETATDTESWKYSNEMLGPCPTTLSWNTEGNQPSCFAQDDGGFSTKSHVSRMGSHPRHSCR